MKKIFMGLVSMALAISLAGCQSSADSETTTPAPQTQPETTQAQGTDGIFTPGTYTGTAKGMNGDITAHVTVSKDKIEKITFDEHQESVGISDPAFDKLPGLILEHQSVAVDTISGCTISSTAVLEAVKKALLEAGASEADITKAVEAADKGSQSFAYEADVVIVGAGGAGMTAAYEVLKAGGSVVILEKTASVGGNTIAAGSALNGADPVRQEKMEMTEAELSKIEDILALEPVDDYMKTWQENVQEDLEQYKADGKTYIYDSPDLHKLQTYVGGDYVGNPEMIDRFAEEAAKSVTYLEELGTVWKDDVTAAIGATWNRSHMPESEPWGNKGAAFVLPQVAKVEELGGEVELEHKAEALIMEDGRVTGVSGTTSDGDTFTAKGKKGVIIATGGFGANVEMRQKYNTMWPDLGENVRTTNVPSATGDGIIMAEEAGANLVGMEWIQMITNADKQDFSAAINNIIYVNAEGERYVKEDGRRDEIASATLAQTDSFCYWICDSQETKDRLGGVTYAGFVIDDLIDGELMFKADTLEELAEQLGIDPETLKKTVEDHNQCVDAQNDPLGRQLFGVKIEKGPFYANRVTAKVHHTMGGIEIDPDTHVLDKEGNVIPGLYAAGEVTGGIHGSNRLGGNAIADVVSFGRIAGQEIMR